MPLIRPGKAMVEKAKESIRIDLNQFKLHIKIEHRIELSLHFDSPSRRFYLSLVAFVVNEMQKLGKVTSIPLEEHYEVLALLNETVGGSAGSSEKENLLPRIYKKWKGALPDLEDAPLFRVMGRKKEYDNGIVRTYRFAEEEKDSWANLFEYKGSGEHVRLRFSIDKLGASLSDVVIVYGEDPELANADAWERFITDLREKLKDKPKPESAFPVFTKEPETPVSQLGKWKIALPSRWKRPALAALVVLVVVAGVWALWSFYFRPPALEPASVEKMAYPLPDKPSIAVLPFTNLSGDPEQEYFSDGMTEELITALSKVPYMFVIARNSTFSYKGTPVNIRQVAEELGVRYVLEGSFRKAGDKVRITAQLIDAIKGHHLWAERYERELKDTFALQDEITMEILSALDVRLTEGEQATIRGKVTDNLEAYLKVLQARWYFDRRDKEGFLLARQLAEEAVALDPEYARPYGILAACHIADVWFGRSKSPKKSLEQALELAQKAIYLDQSDPSCYALLSSTYMFKRQHERAIAEAERAIALDPNGAGAHSQLGIVLVYAGRQQEAIAPLEKAIRMNPLPPSLYFGRLGVAYRDTGRYEEAIAQFKKAISLAPDIHIPHLFMASTYSLAGRDEEARAEASEVLRIRPKFSLERFEKRLFYKNKVDTDRFIDALRKAGLK